MVYKMFDFKMPWTETIKKKICRFLLQRYIGQFLEEKLKLEQLNIDLGSGKGTVEAVTLSCNILNKLCEDNGYDVIVTRGDIGFVTVNIPWQAIMLEDCYTEIGNLFIALKPIHRQKNPGSLFESMLHSMSSSMQLAQDCLEKEGHEELTANNTIEGLERFAQLIDSVLKRVKVKFIDTTIKIEFLSESHGVALIIKIESFCYENESDPNHGEDQELNDTHDGTEASNQTYFLPSYTTHHLKFSGITFYTEEIRRTSQEKHNMPEAERFCDTELNESQFSNRNCTALNQCIPFARMIDEQEIKIKVKQDDKAAGPKIELDATFGPLIIFITPRQLHMFLYLLQYEHESVATEKKELINDMFISGTESPFTNYNSTSNMIATKESWSEALDPSHGPSISYQNKACFTSFTSSVDSSISSASTAHTSRTSCRERFQDTECHKITHFQIRLAYLSATVLHDDILMKCSLPCFNVNHISDISLLCLKEKAESFLCKFEAMTKRTQDIEKIDLVVQQLVEHQNLHLTLVPLNIVYEEQRNSKGTTEKYNITIVRLNLTENLNQNTTVPLIQFARSFETANLQSQPEFQIRYTTTTEGTSRIKDFYCIYSETDLVIDLAPVTMELDVSILDRLHTLRNGSPFKNKHQDAKTYNKNYIVKKKYKLNAASIGIKLRFPIVDLRPIHERHPWWKRNIRPDFLLLSLDETYIQTESGTQISAESNITLRSKLIQIDYFENELTNKMQIALISSTINSNGTNSCLDQPEIIIYTNNVQRSVSLLYQRSTEDDKLYTPFSSKKVLRESETCHGRDSCNDPETFIIPADTVEMGDFCSKSIQKSKLYIEFNLPKVVVELRSKDIYEIIYNRINSDLLLWESIHPNANLGTTTTSSLHDGSKADIGFANDPYDSGATKTHSHGGSDDSEIFYSTINQFSDTMKDFHEIAFKCNINNCALNCFAPVRDDNNIILPNKCGEFYIVLKNSYIFVVCGVAADKNKSFICFNSQSIQMHHSTVDINKAQTSISLERNSLSTELKAILYPSPKKICQQQPKGSSNRDMISLAMQINKFHNEYYKKIKIAIGVQLATIRHITTTIQHAWYTQLADLFNVNDYPVNGYVPSSNMVELHTHLWDCSADYRPLYLPYRVILKEGTVMASCNIASDISGCTLRFVAEDVTLSIAPKSRDNNNLDSVIALPPEDLVCVAELGLFEISLRSTEKATTYFPKLDIRAAINDVHIRTCSDSAEALSKLALYITKQGDLNSQDEGFTTNSQAEQKDENVKIISNKDNTEDNEQQYTVSNMLIDAMEENNGDIDVSLSMEEHFDKIHEEQVSYPVVLSNRNQISEKITEPVSQVQEDLGDAFSIIKDSAFEEDSDVLSNDSFDTFCDLLLDTNDIIGLEASKNQVCIVDNHYTSHGRVHDLFKTPTKFPMVITRVTLCEMSVTWHMFGGKDFHSDMAKETIDNEGLETIRFQRKNMSEAYKFGVSYSKGSPSGPKASRSKLTWRTKGGELRDHNVLMDIIVTKFQLMSETYPKNTEQVSWHVLVVQDFEIRDRLAASDINKFLYFPRNKIQNYVLVSKWLLTRANGSENDCSLKISMENMRLNVDQDSLLFIIDFVSQMNKDKKNAADNKAPITDYPHDTPVMSVEIADGVKELKARRIITENITKLENQMTDNSENTDSEANDEVELKDAPIFFRSISFTNDVSICFDYQSKRVDLTHGPIAGLVMGLASLNCSKIVLKKVSYRHGVLGINKLANMLFQTWLNDIKKKQLPIILGGCNSLKSVIQIVQAVFDLIWIPVKQYRKDGRIGKGVTLGFESFSARTAIAALEFTTQVIDILQIVAEIAYDVFSPGPSMRMRKVNRGRKRMHPPQDIREGVANALQILKEGIGDTAHQVFESTALEHDQRGAVGAVGSVVRHIPSLLLNPAVLATRATSNVLGGVKNQLLPDARAEAKQKWKYDDDQS